PSGGQLPHRGSVWIGSSPLYRRGTFHEITKSHSAAACGLGSSPLYRRGPFHEITKSHIAAACGFVQVLSTGGAPSTRVQNPTSRQRVDSFKSSLPARHLPRDHKIPHRGSVWIGSSPLYPRGTFHEITKSHIAAACGLVQVLSKIATTTISGMVPRR